MPKLLNGLWNDLLGPDVYVKGDENSQIHKIL